MKNRIFEFEDLDWFPGHIRDCMTEYPRFKVSRLFFTYILPVISICIIWDGIISLSRLYHPAELLELSKVRNNESYVWKTGKVRNKIGMSISYLLGYPVIRS
jgi:hypothetical protein